MSASSFFPTFHIHLALSIYISNILFNLISSLLLFPSSSLLLSHRSLNLHNKFLIFLFLSIHCIPALFHSALCGLCCDVDPGRFVPAPPPLHPVAGLRLPCGGHSRGHYIRVLGQTVPKAAGSRGSRQHHFLPAERGRGPGHGGAGSQGGFTRGDTTGCRIQPSAARWNVFISSSSHTSRSGVNEWRWVFDTTNANVILYTRWVGFRGSPSLIHLYTHERLKHLYIVLYIYCYGTKIIYYRIEYYL